MKTIFTAVALSNPSLNAAVKRELTSAITGIVITDDRERADVIVSDDYIDECDVDISELIRRILSEATKKNQSVFAGRETEAITVIGIRSDFGGSGVTSTALTAARLLNILPGKKAVFVNMTENCGFKLYFREKVCSRQRELAFMLEKGYPFNVDSYITRDDEGLPCIDCGSRGDWNEIFSDKLECLLRGNCRSAGFDYAVVDLGNNQADWCDVTIDVYRDDDLRNQCISSDKHGNGFLNKTDNKGFTLEEGRLRISTDGIFLDSVKTLIKRII